MALASTIETNSGAITPTGIIVGLAPGSDPNAPVELWRAADSAGAPDTANAVMVFSGIVPPSGISFFDQLPSTAATYWYRSRINGGQYGPGPYTDWLNLGAPDRVAPDALAALLSGDNSQRSVMWEQANARIGSHSQQILPNAGFEDGEAFWVTQLGTGTIQTSSANSQTGNKHLQLVSTTGVEAYTAACDDVGRIRYFEVNQNDVVQFGGWAYRVSGTANVKYWLIAVDKDKGFVADVFTPTQNTAAWARVQGQYTVPAGVKYVALRAYIDATGTGVTARFDNVFLRIAFGSSTIHNAQGSVIPIASNPNFGTVGGNPAAGGPWLAFSFAAPLTIYRADQSTLVIPATPGAGWGQPGNIAAPGLAAGGTGGLLGTGTFRVRIGFVKNGGILMTGNSATIAVTAGQNITVTAPTAPSPNPYDGWIAIWSDAAGGVGSEFVRNVTGAKPDSVTAFGSNFVITAVGTKLGDNMGNITTAVGGNNAFVVVTGLAASTSYYLYPYIDLVLVDTLAILDTATPPTTPSAPVAALQNGDTRIPLSYGALPAVTVPASGVGNNTQVNLGGKFK